MLAYTPLLHLMNLICENCILGIIPIISIWSQNLNCGLEYVAEEEYGIISTSRLL